MNKKIIIVAIAVILLITGLAYSGIMKKSMPAATDQAIDQNTPADNTQQNSDQAATKDIQGKVLGIGEKNIAIEKTGGSEMININPNTPVSAKDKKGADVKSSLAMLKVGSEVDVTYDNSSNALSISILK